MKKDRSHYRDLLALPDFCPSSQDRLAIQRFEECWALPDVRAGNFSAALAKCRNIWASLPGAGYGQREHHPDDLIEYFIAAGGRLTA